MKMLLCLLVLAAALEVKAQNTEALQSYASNNEGFANVTAGWSFQPLTNVTVTALGCFDYIVTDQQGPMWVGLWAADGTLLASNTVTTNSTLVNQTRYGPITAVPLLQNKTYYVGAFPSLGGMIIKAFAPGVILGFVSMAPEIQLGMAVGSTNSSLSFPGMMVGPSNSALLAPNFEFQDGIESPVLGIVFTNNELVISWPASYSGFVLQENRDLTSTNWMTMTNPVVNGGTQNQVLIPFPAGNNFYRLNSQ